MLFVLLVSHVELYCSFDIHDKFKFSGGIYLDWHMAIQEGPGLVVP
jgi:hypothetical protein